MLHMATGYTTNIGDPRYICNAALVHEHFGCSKPVNRLLTNQQAENWTSEVSFPRLLDDPLLFILLTNSEKQASFMLNTKRVPYRLFLLAMMNSNEYRRTNEIFKNNQQRTNDGMHLEALTCGAVCAASHVCGLTGVPFWTFLEEFVYEMSIPPPMSSNPFAPSASIPKRIRKGLFASGGPCDKFMKTIIPYMSPPNQQWPVYVDEHYNVDNLIRMKNSDGFDIKCGPDLSLEDKSQKRHLSSKQLKSMFKRVPEKSKVHIIPVESMQQTYFTKTSTSEGLNWESIVGEYKHLKDTIVLVIDTDTSMYVEVPGLTDASRQALGTRKARKVIIFLSLNFEEKMTKRIKYYANLTFPSHTKEGSDEFFLKFNNLSSLFALSQVFRKFSIVVSCSNSSNTQYVPHTSKSSC